MASLPRPVLIAVLSPKVIKAILNHPAHRDDDPDSGLDSPQLTLDLQPQIEAFESA